MEKNCVNCAYSFFSDLYLECSIQSRINDNTPCDKWTEKSNAPHKCVSCKYYHNESEYCGMVVDEECDEWQS